MRSQRKQSSGEIEIVPNMMHGYSCMPVFPESKKSDYEGISLIERL